MMNSSRFVSRETRFEIQVRCATLTADLQDWQEPWERRHPCLPLSANGYFAFSLNTRSQAGRDSCAPRMRSQIIDSPRKGIVR